MQNNIPKVYISEIYCCYDCIVKSTNLSTILQFCTKNMKKLKISSQNKKVQQKCNLSWFLYCFTSTKILTRSRHPG